MMKELECRCETCNIEIYKITMLPFGCYDHNICSPRWIRKFGRHVVEGHVVTNEIYSVYYDQGYQVRIRIDDIITRDILDKDVIIMP